MIEPSQYAWPGPFQVPLPSGDKVTVTLYHHPEKSEAPDGSSQGSGLFTVTHIPTGFAVLQKMTRGDAIKFASRLQSLNWNFKRPHGARKLYPAVRKILDELVAGRR